MGNNYFNACTVVNENSCRTPALRTYDRFQDIIVMSKVSLWGVNDAISCNYQKLTKCAILGLFEYALLINALVCLFYELVFTTI